MSYVLLSFVCTELSIHVFYNVNSKHLLHVCRKLATRAVRKVRRQAQISIEVAF
jgi:hypothetical protein